MIKSELVQAVAARNPHLYHRDVENIVNAVLDEITDALADGSIFTGRQGLENGLVDDIGGEPEIRAYLKERGVDDRLEMVKWEPRRENRDGWLPSVVGKAIQQVTGAPFSLSEEIGELGGGKLFLDGLVSLWQAGGNSPMTVEGGHQ